VAIIRFSFFLYIIGCLPIFIFLASPNRDASIAAFLSVFTFFAWALATYRVWMLCHIRVSVGPDVISYETERGKVVIPKGAVRRFFISAGHIVIERTDATRVAIPMMFARNAILYAQLASMLSTSDDPEVGPKHSGRQ
jgi:hypothetical protein